MAWEEATYTLTCTMSGAEHVVTTATPFRYDKMDAAPLILCLDGSWTAGTVRDATRIMSMSGEAPEAIVVGLSFNDQSMSAYLRSRARWFCPTQWVPPEIVGVKGAQAEDIGHALTYLAFIRDHVLPRLEADFRISERWLVGHSFSGLFGFRTLFAEPELFDKYLLASPSIWWDSTVIFDIEAEYAAGNDDLQAKVFLTAGEDEDLLGGEFNMCNNVEDMVDRLKGRGYRSLLVSHEILAGESHSSTIGGAISSGLRRLHRGG